MTSLSPQRVWLTHHGMAFGFEQCTLPNNNKSFQSAWFAAFTPTHPLERLQSVLHDFENGGCLWDDSNRFTCRSETAVTFSREVLQSGSTFWGHKADRCHRETDMKQLLKQQCNFWLFHSTNKQLLGSLIMFLYTHSQYTEIDNVYLPKGVYIVLH